MEIAKEIVTAAVGPTAILGGAIVGVLLLTQRMSMVLTVLALFIAWCWIILVSKFQVETEHGVYSYQADAVRGGDITGHYPILSPETMPADQVHLAGINFAAAIVWIIIIRFGIGALISLRKQPLA